MSLPSDPATRQDLEDLKKLVQELIQQLSQRIDARFDAAVELSRSIETNLLTEFHRYAKGQTSRMHAFETTGRDMAERMHQLEERVLELEGRIRPK